MKKELQKLLLSAAIILCGSMSVKAQWTSISALPPSPYGNDGAVSFTINNKGYVAAGSSTSNVYIYDTLLNTWSFADTVPATMGHAFAMSFVVDNKAYVVGGDVAGVPQSTVWEFDPSNATTPWTQKHDFPAGARDGGFGFTIGGSGYVGAGNDNITFFNDIWKYNPGDDSWTMLTATLPVSGLIFPSSFVIGNKAYILFGGLLPYGVNEITNMWCLDGANDSLVAKASFAGSGRQAGFAFSNNTYGFAGGGQAGYTTNYNDMWKYDPVSDHWSASVSAPLLGAAWSSVFVIGNTAYAGLGAKFISAGLTGDLNFYKFRMSTITGIDDINENKNQWTLYPNPASESVTIQLPKSEKMQVDIYSALGEKVMSKKIENSETISVSDFSSGMYYVKITSNHGTSESKLIIKK